MMSYGTSIADAYRIGGGYRARILFSKAEARRLSGPTPKSTKVEFVLNMKVAKVLGLSIPLPLLGRADARSYNDEAAPFIGWDGGAAAWPVMARGQQAAVPVIGYFNALSEAWNRSFVPAFLRGLEDQGFVEGRDVKVLYRYADGQYDRLPGIAAEWCRFVSPSFTLLVVPLTALAAKAVTQDIPIIFDVSGDPVELGLVSSLSRPSGNITGVATRGQALTAKRLELLRETVPMAGSIGYLVNPAGPLAEVERRDAETAAQRLGIRLIPSSATKLSEMEAAFTFFDREQIDALLVGGDPFFAQLHTSLIELSARRSLPTIYHIRQIAELGGLMSYGTDVRYAERVGGSYVGRVLRGEKPGDLPVQQTGRIEFVLNMKTAKALGLSVPPKILALADEVIE